jgi:hypothetical protein
MDKCSNVQQQQQQQSERQIRGFERRGRAMAGETDRVNAES